MAQVYRPDIDGLRAIAISLVVIFHFNIFEIGKAGFIGVDLFFVISGYLIGGIIFRDLAAGTFNLWSFLYRRFRRLYPAMLATLLLTLAAGYWLLLPNLFNELAVEVLMSQLYVANIYFWRTVNYFGLQVDQVPLLHMWSLSLEEQFYLVFPVVALLIYRRWPGQMSRLVWLALGLSFLTGLYAMTTNPTAAFYLLPTRAWEFLAGVALVRMAQPTSRLWRFAGGVGLVLLVVAIMIHNPSIAVPGWYAMLPVIAAVLIIAEGSATQGGPVKRALSWQPVVWLGQISYPLYLVHWPILILMKDVLQAFDIEWRLLGLVLSVALGAAIHHWVELPIKRGRVLTSPGRVMAAFGGGTVALMVLSAVVVSDRGMPGRFDPQVETLLAYRDDQADIYQRCGLSRTAQLPPCTLGVDGPPTRLILGDSHGRALAGALDQWLNETGQTAAFGFAHGCLPVAGYGGPDCRDPVQMMLQTAKDRPEITEFMIVSLWRQPYLRTGMVYENRWLERDAAAAALAGAVSGMVTDLQDAGVKVTLVEPLFIAPNNVPEALAKNLAFGRDLPVDVTLEEHYKSLAALEQVFVTAQEIGARRVSILGELCDGGLCRGSFEGAPVFSDNNHLRFGMMPYMAGVIAAEMAKLP